MLLMKTLTQNTSARITNPAFRTNTGMLSSRAAQRVRQGRLQRFLETLRRRLFVFNTLAPVWAYSNQGGALPIWRDIQNVD